MAPHIKRQPWFLYHSPRGYTLKPPCRAESMYTRLPRSVCGWVQGIIKKRSFNQVSRVDKSQVLYQTDSAKYKAAYDNAKEAQASEQ